MQHAIALLKEARDTAKQNSIVASVGGRTVESFKLLGHTIELTDAINNLEYEWHFRQREIHEKHLIRLDKAIDIRREEILQNA